ncbi:MAG: hypothetical protein [Namikivirus tsukuho]|uniref:Phage conserved hypothetical protein C-terminal domain-containing protein n=1 Tax=Bacteriophage sp. TaxID=38018 RepID=A0ABY5TV06_9VIRU|nr:MAG: hypothetical protein [Bacteriophage sp.]
MKKHIFDTDVAQLVGINAAVLLENISHWCEHNAANNANLHDGHYWTYNSTKAFSELFPYMTVNVLRTAIKKLKNNGLILTGNYNKSAYDRTMWYTLTEKAETLLGVNTHSDEPDQGGTADETPVPASATTQGPWGDTASATTDQSQLQISEPQPPAQPKEPDPTEEIVEHLNQRAGTHYRATTANTRKLIKARLKEGFTVDEIKLVIDKKCAEWLNNRDMVQYLRPETLFGNKFESYLNAKSRPQASRTGYQPQPIQGTAVTILPDGHVAECTQENGWF